MVAYPVTGPLTNFLSRALRRCYHSETHTALIVPFIVAPPRLLPLGDILHEQWSVYIAAIGPAMQVSGLVLVPSSVISVVVDGWPASGSEALVLINADYVWADSEYTNWLASE